MARIFISHSSSDNVVALAIGEWLRESGWDDVFLDISAQGGIVPGERWEKALHDAASRCEAVIFLISRRWLGSDWCLKEMRLAQRLNKRLFGVLIEDIPVEEIPAEIVDSWQLGNLVSGTDHRQFEVTLPDGQRGYPTLSQAGLDRLRNGLRQAGLDPRFFAWPPDNDPDRSPYRGLAPMEAEDAGIFYGRDAPLVEAMDLLRGMRDGAAPRVLALLGASGAGKSSFLRAGLLPRLRRDDRAFRPLPIVRPESAALWGHTGLQAALAKALSEAGVSVARNTLRSAIEAGGDALAGWFAKLAPEERPPTLVLPIDQGEELFGTDGRDEADRLLELLAELAGRPDLPLLLLFTIRSDSYERLQTAPQFEELRPRTYGLGPMPRGAYQTLIEGPAARYTAAGRKLVIDPRLTTRLLADLEDGGGSDTLPLLAFTLERLFFEHGEDGDLTLEEYVTFNGVSGAIDNAVARAMKAADADPAVMRDPAERLVHLRRGLIPWLAGIDPVTRRPRRRVAPLSDIPREAQPLMRHLVDVRLLAVDTDANGEQTVEPTHEALFRQWGLLKGWLEEDAAVLATLAGVQDAARDWAANARDPVFLVHRGARLGAAEGLNQRPDLSANLDAQQRDYLAACRKREDAERDRELAEARMLAEAQAQAAQQQREVSRRTRIGLVAASLLAVLAIGAAIYGLLNAQEADAQRLVADDQRAIADDERRAAELQGARVATMLAPTLLADGRVDESLLLLLDARQTYGDAPVPGDMMVAFNEALEIATTRQTLELPPEAAIFGTRTAVYVHAPRTDELLRFDAEGPRLDRVATGTPGAPAIIALGDGPDGPLIVRADLSVAALGADGTMREVGAFEMPADFTGTLASYDEFAFHADGHVEWRREADWQILDTARRELIPDLPPIGFDMPIYVPRDTGERYLVLANVVDGELMNRVHTLGGYGLSAVIGPETDDPAIAGEAVFADCLRRGESGPADYIPELLSGISYLFTRPICTALDEGEVILSDFNSGSAGLSRSDRVYSPWGGPPEDVRGWAPLMPLAGQPDWIGYADGIIAARLNRDIGIGPPWERMLLLRSPEAPSFSRVLPGNRIVLAEPLAGKLVVQGFGGGARDSLRLADAEPGRPFAPLHFGTCVGYALNDLVDRTSHGPDGTTLELTGGTMSSASGPPGVIIAGGPAPRHVVFGDAAGCLQVSGDRTRLLTVVDGIVTLYDLAGLAAGRDAEAAELGRLPRIELASAVFAGAENDIVTTSWSVAVERWRLADGAWTPSTLYSGDAVIGYAELNSDESQLLIIKFLDGGDARGALYSFAARREWLQLGSDYKWFGAAFGLADEITTTAHFGSRSFLRLPTVDALAAEARAILPAECAPATPDDYPSSPCWPSQL